MLTRQLHPVTDVAQAQANRARICARRGFCGPFLNQEFYARYPDPLWHGMAECIHCCTTVHLANEFVKWECSLWEQKFGLSLEPVTSSDQ